MIPDDWILTLLILLPLAGAVGIGFINGLPGALRDARVRKWALGVSVATLVVALLALRAYHQATDADGRRIAETGEYALVAESSWISPQHESGVEIGYAVGVDGLSVWLLALTAFITPLTIWASFTSIRERVKEYYLLMLLLEAGMIGVFCARDLLWFYIFFEFTLIPLFFLIGIWGGSQRKEAAHKFFLYTFAGSVLTFAGVLYLAYCASRPFDLGGVDKFTFKLDALYQLQLSSTEQFWLFLAFAAGFSIKVPLFPFHTWLPLAHTEAPTAGSVLLAGVLLKLGTYGFLRFSVPMLPDAAMKLAPIVGVLAIAGILYGALVAWVQSDVKKLIAYSSVSHLGFCILGMFSLTLAGMTGSVLYMVNHGLSTGALFLLIGMLYERYHTREFAKIGGLARRMPLFAFFLIFFTLTSIALPGLNGFVSEFLVLLGTVTSGRGDPTPMGPLNWIYAAFAAIGIVLGAIYMLHMCQRVLFGPLIEPEGTPDISRGLTADLTPREVGILTPIAVLCVVLGVVPNVVIDSIQPAARRQVLQHVYPGEGMVQDDSIDLESVFEDEPLAMNVSPRRISADVYSHTPPYQIEGERRPEPTLNHGDAVTNDVGGEVLR